MKYLENYTDEMLCSERIDLERDVSYHEQELEFYTVKLQAVYAEIDRRKSE